MDSTMDLLDEAIRETELSARQLSQKLGHSPWALARARGRGSLSPTLAGQIAEMLDRNVERWMAIAALENEPDHQVKAHLWAIIENGPFPYVDQAATNYVGKS